MNRSIALFAIAAAALPACTLVDAEVAVGEVCITRDDVHIAAAPVSGELQQQIVVDDLRELDDLTEHADALAFRRAELTATSAITDLAFVERARIVLSPADASLPPLTLVACDGDCVSRAATLTLTSDDTPDVLPYLQADAVTLDLDLAGELPAVDWTLRVVVCFEGTAGYEVLF